MIDTRCPDCGAPRESITASCDVCPYDPDRFVSEADTTWTDGSPATRLLTAGNSLPEVLPIRDTIGPTYNGPVLLRDRAVGDCDEGDTPAPPADLLTVERDPYRYPRWWGWAVALSLVVGVALRGCR